MFQPITKAKANSSYQTKPVSTTGPNSARGGKIDFGTSGAAVPRRQAFVQNSMNRTQSINLGSRAGSIDKKMRQPNSKFVTQNPMLKGNNKTQSLILSKNELQEAGFHSTKNKFFNNDLNANR
jgi:hypothetical protein